MRRRFLSLFLALLPVAACHRDSGGGADSGAAAARAEGQRGPDPVLVRLPRDGGTARAYLFPKLDSVIWSGHTTSVERVLGFDPEGGALAIVDAKGKPARVDFRLGEASIASKTQLTSLTAPSGADIYGIDSHGAVVRLTRAGEWDFTPPAPARGVFPQGNGSLLVAAQKGDAALVWRMYPPDTRLRDTVRLPITLRGAHAQVGDRVYFATDTAIVGVSGRDLSPVPSIHVEHRVVALAPTPSGDRLYVATADNDTLSVVDRYTDKIAARITLPGEASELRMDRLGRYVLARPARGDSAWVIAVATNHVIGSARTRWSDDLPTAAPDGEIVVSVGRDVLMLDGETLQPLRTIAGGASDYWLFVFWNGFRPRAAGVDQPVSFATADTTDTTHAASDTAASVVDTTAAGAASAAKPAPAAQPATRPAATRPPAAVASAAAGAAAAPKTAPAKPAAAEQWTVSFAALLTPDKAHALADSIHVGDAAARVVAAQRGGATVYRVVLGPYPTRAAADQIGRESKRSYWVYSGQP